MEFNTSFVTGGPDFTGSQQWTCKAEEAIKLKLVSVGAEGLQQDEFKPVFTHQLFGESESIVGYKNLDIQLSYAADTLFTHFSINYSQVLPENSPIVKTVLLDSLKPILPKDYTQSRETFEKELRSSHEKFEPPGTIIYQREDPEDPNATLIITNGNNEDRNFATLFRRIATFSIFFIEQANIIDEDPRWDMYLLFKKIKAGNTISYKTLGFCNVYNFFSYQRTLKEHEPAKFRSRLSQILILPPYQKHHCGSLLYRIIFEHKVNDSRVTQFTVEDPAPDFQLLRTTEDLRFLMSEKCDNLRSRLSLSIPSDLNDHDLLRAEAKLSKKQSLVLYELLLLSLKKYTKKSPEFIAFVKKRLYNENEMELSAAETPEIRTQELNKLLYEELKNYEFVLTRLHLL